MEVERVEGVEGGKERGARGKERGGRGERRGRREGGGEERGGEEREEGKEEGEKRRGVYPRYSKTETFLLEALETTDPARLGKVHSLCGERESNTKHQN
jgi:hypothetical protein